MTARQDLVAFLLERVSRRIGAPPEAIGLDADLIELGLKSIDALLISGEIEDRFGVEVDPVILFECRTIDGVAGTLADRLG